jgi:hypothetical protein
LTKGTSSTNDSVVIKKGAGMHLFFVHAGRASNRPQVFSQWNSVFALWNSVLQKKELTEQLNMYN